MGYLIAFLVFLLIISIIGFLFSILWPLLILIIVVVAISNFVTYRRRKTDFSNYTQSTYQEQSNTLHDEVIDVEFSEEDINER